MRAFEAARTRAPEDLPVRMAVGVNEGPYRLRGASDASLPSYGYGQRTTLGQQAMAGFRAILRTFLPVLALGTALGAMYLYMDTQFRYFADAHGPWLTVGHLLLPLAFLAVHLTNRRYGPAYAFAQVVLALAALAALALFGGDFVHGLLPASVAFGMREVAAFAGAFLVASFLSIIAFDGARGPRWWSAPLLGSIVAGLVYAPTFYLAAYLGTGEPWLNHMAVYAGLLLAGAVLSLVPFWLLRGVVQPLPGFGGY